MPVDIIDVQNYAMTPADPDEVMRDHGFPPALLPRPVTASLYDAVVGAFEVHLPARVTRRVDSYRVRYDTVIRGQISEGRITELRGVSAKRGLWFGVTEITVRGEKLAFAVGPVVKHLPARAFT